MTLPVIALAGNPNVGKSTIFNALTGSHQHVGNWPGKTVARQAGTWNHGGRRYTIIDLPGTYSLSAFSPEEQIARDFLVDERPQLVINVVDAANLERNLYLTAQILETGVPLLLALNMHDIAMARGMSIDSDRLAAELGNVPVISLIASRNQGLDGLKQAIVGLTAGQSLHSPGSAMVAEQLGR